MYNFLNVLFLASAIVSNVHCQIFIRGRFGGLQAYDPINLPHSGQIEPPNANSTGAYGGHALVRRRGDVAVFADDDSHCTLYTAITESTRQLMSMNEKRIWFGMTNIHDDVLVCGGLTEDTWPPPVKPKATCEIFITDSWLPFPSMPMPLYCTMMVTIHGRPHILGGRTSSGAAVDTMYIFAEGKWTNGSKMPLARFGATALIYDDDVAIVCGGQDYVNGVDKQYGECMAYVTSQDAWVIMDDWTLNEPRAGHGMAEYRGRTYIYGGHQGAAIGGKMLASVEMLDVHKGWQLLPHPLFAADWWFQTIAYDF